MPNPTATTPAGVPLIKVRRGPDAAPTPENPGGKVAFWSRHPDQPAVQRGEQVWIVDDNEHEIALTPDAEEALACGRLVQV